MTLVFQSGHVFGPRRSGEQGAGTQSEQFTYFFVLHQKVSKEYCTVLQCGNLMHKLFSFFTFKLDGQIPPGTTTT